MKKLLLLGMLLLSSGCQSMNNTEAGALGGGVIGAGLGTVIGGLTGHPLAGAAIGAGSGLVAGTAVGAAADNREARADARAAAIAARNPPLSLPQIADMAQKHISDDLIINQIRTTGSVYNLSPDDISYLKSQGVSDTVVFEMQSRRGIVPVRGRTVYVVDPAPPPVSVGFGFGYGRGCWR